MDNETEKDHLKVSSDKPIPPKISVDSSRECQPITSGEQTNQQQKLSLNGSHVMAALFAIFSTFSILILVALMLQSSTKFEVEPKVSFDLHYFFLFIGGIILLPAAAIIFRVVSSSKYVAKILHTLIHLIALLFVASGLWVIIHFKEQNNKTHFYTFHGIFGIMTASTYLLTAISGIFVFWILELPIATKIKIKYVHVAVGKALIVSMALVAFLGMGRYFWKVDDSYDVTNVFASLLSFSAFSILFITIIFLFGEDFRPKYE